MKTQEQTSSIQTELKQKKAVPGKNYKYVILALGCLSSMIAIAIPSMSLSVLMPDISEELDLTLTQVGFIWGIGSFPAIVAGVFAGALGDKFGLKRIAMLACFMFGLVYVLEALSPNFIVLSISVILGGLISPFLINNMNKLIGFWFHEKERGIATGLFSMIMALGFLIGSLFSASVFAPLLGGWRYVFIMIGGCTWLLIVPWAFMRKQPTQDKKEISETVSDSNSIFAGLLYSIKFRDLWILGLAGLFIGGSMYALLGYLPMHLEALEWSSTVADSAVASFYFAGMLTALPISFLAEKTGKRKLFMIILTCITIIGFGILLFAREGLIWLGIILVGMCRDAYMAISTTMVLSVKGLSYEHLGSASSFVTILFCFGYLSAPMIGNKLAETSMTAPFIFWIAFMCIGVIFLFLIPSKRSKSEEN